MQVLSLGELVHVLPIWPTANEFFFAVVINFLGQGLFESRLIFTSAKNCGFWHFTQKRLSWFHLFLINLEVWNFITLKLSYLCSTLNFRRRDPFQNWPLHPLAVNMVGWFLIQLKMNLSVVQLFYLLALFWQKSSHALPALYPGSGLLKLVIDTELLHNKHYKSCID